jgi:lysophospholipase L1-like esterase
MSLTPIYEKDFENSFCEFHTIGLNEYNNIINDSGYIYSGITLVLDFTGFTAHFDTIEHEYHNIILNNDVYTYTGLTGETHYFEIDDFYSGYTPSIDPLLTGFTESEIISGFTTSLISCTEKLDGLTGTCCPTQQILSNLPWVCITNEGGGTDNCSDYIARRTSTGWMLDFVFNKNGVTGWTDTVFFFTGVRDEYDPANYGDNNLSFAFTSDGRIKWSSYRYSGYCDTISGYTGIYYINTGQTLPLCSNGTLSDFNITITFERYYEYSGCSLSNEGGWNDLIADETTMVEALSSKWMSERSKRLGTLKFYHNGRPLKIDVPLSSISNFRNLPVYKVEEFEEIVLSDRGYQPFTHIVGGGVTGSGGLHEGVCCYIIKYGAYFEEPMKFIDIRNRYLTETAVNYDINECEDACIDNLYNILRAPTGLTATIITGETECMIDLIWTNINIFDNGVRIMRSIDSGFTYSNIDAVGFGINYYIDTGATSGYTYYYKIIAVRGLKESMDSNIAIVLEDDLWSCYWASRFPSGLSLYVNSDTQITANHTNNGVQDYDEIVYEVNGTDSYTAVAGTTSKALTGLTAETLYSVRLRYRKGTNYSAYSNIVSDTTNTLLVNLTRNTDSVPINSVTTPSNTVTYLAATSGNGDFILNRLKTDRIRQAGNIIGMTLAKINSLTNVTIVQIIIWRKNVGNLYDKVATSENLIGKISAGGIQTITLTTPLTVQEGDYIGFLLKTSSGSTNVLAADALANGMYYNITTIPADTDENWVLHGSSSNFLSTNYMLSQAPLLVGIGDSIMESYPLHESYVDPSTAWNGITKSWLYKLSQLNPNIIVQNLGIGGQTTTQIEARFDSQVVNAKPRVVVIDGAINEIPGGDEVTFLAKYTSMFDKCVTNNIIPIVWKMTPWTAGTNAQLQTRDIWNTDLTTLFNSYGFVGGTIIDWGSLLGQFRAGGDPGNLWDIIPAYNVDNVHFNEAGQTVIANYVYSLLTSLNAPN